MVALFAYWYFNEASIIGIGILELVFFKWNWILECWCAIEVDIM